MRLRISEDLSLPIEAVTEKSAFLGRTGSGKTYAAQKLAEEMHRAGAQFVALDPVGKWWSLRLSADGKTPALPIPVFGGLHGDIPLESGAGKLMADLVVDRGISAVIDVSQFESDTQKARFMTDFGNRFFFRKKASPSAIHLFIEEAQEFVPQNPQRDEAVMLHAWTRIQKLGRNFGIGSSLITQRPQEVNKKVLNLTEVLFVFQLTGTHERESVARWIEDKGLDEDIAAELPKLAVGKPHVWSPAWLQISKIISIGQKRTYDASRTPTVGRRQDIKELTPIDLAKLQKDMAATIERAKQEDPRALRREIADLRHQLTSKRDTPSPKAEKSSPVVEVPIIRPRELKALQKSAAYLETVWSRFETAGKAMREETERLKALMNGRVASLRTPQPVALPRPAVPIRLAPRQGQPTPVSTAERLTGPEQRILDAIAWIESLGQPDADQAAVAFLAGYTVGGGAFNNPRGKLHTRGLIEYRGGRLALTVSGHLLARIPTKLLNTDELHAAVLERLPGPEGKILRVLLDVYPKAVSHTELAERAGYSDGGGAFNNPRGRLRSLGLIDYPAKGMAIARSLLFFEG